MNSTDTCNKLSNLRERLDAYSVDGFIQSTGDKFQNEYVPDCWQRVQYISSFSGSAGTIVILKNKAALFTDGRYTLQAAAEVDSTYFEIHNSANITAAEWINNNLENSRIGFDDNLLTMNQHEYTAAHLSRNKNQFIAIPNIIDEIWQNRPEEPQSVVFPHPLQYSGKAHNEKIKTVVDALIKNAADFTVICAPDSVCWLLNIRGNDTPNTPFALTHCIIDSSGKATLYLNETRIDNELRTHLHGVIIKPENLLYDDLKSSTHNRAIMLDNASAPLRIHNIIREAGGRIIAAEDPCKLPKAIKNPVELEGMRKAHAIDGAALTAFINWLTSEVEKRSIGEIEASDKLLEFRRQNPEFISPSFDTISGFGANGAIVHYRATKKTEKHLQKNGIYLLDSGGQYKYGTTDVTRTIAIGTPTLEQKRNFTLVLKGHIALATAKFPEGTTGSQLDSLARQFLWANGLDYDHGTGHGVGSFLSVHEGPQRISKAPSSQPLIAGMILSNEPGYYKNGEYGIRIENLVAVVEVGKTETGKKLLGFETLTLAPIDESLIDFSLLTPDEIKWYQDYHAMVEHNSA